MARIVIYSRADLSGKLMGLSCPLKYPLTLPPVMHIVYHNKHVTEQVHFAIACPLRQNAICLFIGARYNETVHFCLRVNICILFSIYF